jgi:hypothetical protein
MGLYFIKIRKTLLQEIRNQPGKMMEKLLGDNYFDVPSKKVDRRKGKIPEKMLCPTHHGSHLQALSV